MGPYIEQTKLLAECFDRPASGLRHSAEPVRDRVNELVQQIFIDVVPYGSHCVFHALAGGELFWLQLLVKHGPKILHGIDIVTLGGPAFNDSNAFFLKETLCGFIGMTSRFVLLQFPAAFFVFEPFRGCGQQSFFQNILISFRAKSPFLCY